MIIAQTVMASVTQPSADAASIIETAHEIRITSHGKYNTWVDFALRHFEVCVIVVPASEPATYSNEIEQ